MIALLQLEKKYETALHERKQNVLLFNQSENPVKGRLLIQMVHSNYQHHHLLLIP